MRIAELRIDSFRGFDSALIKPRGHVALVGEPRAGRSDVVAALERVLHPDGTRWRVREWDFHCGDLDRTISIEATLTGLGSVLRQRFIRRVEVWDQTEMQVVATSEEPVDGEGVEAALRLRWTCTWDRAEERADQRVEYMKRLGGTSNYADRVSRDDRASLPFRSIRQREPLAIRSEGDFRNMLESANSDDVLEAVRGLASGIDNLSADLSQVPAIVEGLNRVLGVLREPLGIEGGAGDVIRFLPDGSTVSGLLRTLTAALDLSEGAGHLPVLRHGSTLVALLSAAEAVWWAGSTDGVVAVDDFGDCLDGPAATRLVSLIKRTVGQAWVSTRRPEVARSFPVEDLVRLTGAGAARQQFQCDPPIDKIVRGAMRHFQLQLLPAMTARAVIICEGRHDVASIRATADRLESVDGTAPPLAHGIELIDGGGKDQMWKVAALARQLGFRTVSLLDWDRDDAEAATSLAKLEDHSDAVVRLPLGFAIERALLCGLNDVELSETLKTVVGEFMLQRVPPLNGLDRAALEEIALSHVLKSGSGGLHGAFVEAMPTGVVPPLIVRVLSVATNAISQGTSGTQQL